MKAVELFQEIGATLVLLPSITLVADPTSFTVSETSGVPFTSKLTWSSTEAQTVSIEGQLDNGTIVYTQRTVTPTEGGCIHVKVSQTTTFIATAEPRARCGNNTAQAKVVVDDGTVIG